MMRPVRATTVPTCSLLQPTLSKADFHDAFRAPLHDDTLAPVEIFLRAARATPAWVSHLMALRNRGIAAFGARDVGALENVGARPAADYKVGDRISIFSIFALTDAELLMGIDDSHLDVRVSVMKTGDGHYVLSTLVKIHNCTGRLYMLPVGRIHPLVVRALMRRAAV